MVSNWIILSLIIIGNCYPQNNNIELVSTIYNCWSIVSDVKYHGDYVYLTTSKTGLRILDVSDNYNPQEVGILDGQNECMNQVLLDNDIAYVTELCESAIHIINIADPTQPVELCFETTYQNDYVAQYSDYLFSTNGFDIINIIDVSNPANPSEENLWQGYEQLANIVINQNYAYVVSLTNGIVILDVSAPLTPVEVCFYEIDEFIFDLKLEDDNLYYSGGDGFVILDISDVQNPVEIGRYSDIIAGQMDYSDDHLYFAVGADGVMIYNVADPNNIYLAGHYELTGTMILAVQGQFIGLVYSPNCFGMLDASNISTPILTGSYENSAGPFDVIIRNNYAYISDLYNGFRVVDVSNPYSPEEISHLEIPGQTSYITMYDDYIYASNGLEGIKIIDVSDPYNPFLAGSFIPSSPTSEFVIDDSIAYYWNLFEGLFVLNLADPVNPVQIGSNAYCVWVNNAEVDGNFIYLGGEGPGIYICDISQPSDPELVVQIGMSVISGSNIELKGDTLTCGLGNILNLISISDPYSPYFIGEVQFEFGGVQQYINNVMHCIGFNNNRLIYEVTSLMNPILLGNYYQPGEGGGFIVDDNLIYTCDTYYFEILDCSEALPVMKLPGSNMPTILSLHPAYPNPFNSNSRIDFSVAKPGIVNLTVYDVLGRVKSVLKNGYLTPGLYTATLDAKDYSSGVYYIQLKQGNSIQVREAVLVK